MPGGDKKKEFPLPIKEEKTETESAEAKPNLFEAFKNLLLPQDLVAQSAEEKKDSSLSERDKKSSSPLIFTCLTEAETRALAANLSEVSIDSSDKEDSDASMSHSSTKIESLTSTNYDSWRIQIEAVLHKNKCWLDLDGADAGKQNYAELAKQAYFEIILKCDPEHAKFAESIGKYDSVKTLSALRNKYEGKGVMSKIEVLQRCLLMRHQGGPVDKHIDDLRMGYQRMTDKGGINIELLQVANLMISLPSDLGNVLTGFNNMKEDDLKFEDVANAILIEQRRRAISQDSGAVAAAAVPKVATKKKNPNLQLLQNAEPR